MAAPELDSKLLDLVRDEIVQHVLGPIGSVDLACFAVDILRAIDLAGYVIVPKVPTNKMVTAALAGLCKEEPDLPWGHDIGGDGARAIWRVMVKAWTEGDLTPAREQPSPASSA